jgi:hypothetical protein
VFLFPISVLHQFPDFACGVAGTRDVLSSEFDLIVPSSPPTSNPEEIQGNFLIPEQTEQRAEHQME